MSTQYFRESIIIRERRQNNPEPDHGVLPCRRRACFGGNKKIVRVIRIPRPALKDTLVILLGVKSKTPFPNIAAHSEQTPFVYAALFHRSADDKPIATPLDNIVMLKYSEKEATALFSPVIQVIRRRPSVPPVILAVIAARRENLPLGFFRKPERITRRQLPGKAPVQPRAKIVRVIPGYINSSIFN